MLQQLIFYSPIFIILSFILPGHAGQECYLLFSAIIICFFVDYVSHDGTAWGNGSKTDPIQSIQTVIDMQLWSANISEQTNIILVNSPSPYFAGPIGLFNFATLPTIKLEIR